MPTCAPILVRVWSYGDPLQERCTGCICFVHFVCILHAIFALRRVGLLYDVARWGCGVCDLGACRLDLYGFCVNFPLVVVFIDFILLQAKLSIKLHEFLLFHLIRSLALLSLFSLCFSFHFVGDLTFVSLSKLFLGLEISLVSSVYVVLFPLLHVLCMYFIIFYLGVSVLFIFYCCHLSLPLPQLCLPGHLLQVWGTLRCPI